MRKLFAALLAAALASGAHAAMETYTLDASHTSVTWSISHFGFSHPSGKFASVQGSLMLDDTAPQNSKVNATITIANLFTGIEKLDTHLKSKDFFGAEQFPTATFVSSKVEPTGKNTAKVTGNLTLHGASKPVTLEVTLNKIGTNMMQKKTAGFSAITTLNRSDFDIKTYLPNLGDEVKITIESEANVQ